MDVIIAAVKDTYHKQVGIVFSPVMRLSVRLFMFAFGILVLFVLTTSILWVSIALYGIFYYSFVPVQLHVYPVHLQFRSCGETTGLCSFPSATVVLTKKPQLLMVGQPYRMLLDIEMPESPVNQQLGMFMVCTELRDKQGEAVESSCRSTMLHYKSTLLHAISTFIFSPLIVAGSSEEKQGVTLELFTEFQENPARPIKEVFVEVQSRFIEIYTMTLRVHAHFTGLRYFMFHWPVLSAVLGVSINLFFLSIIAFLSWYRFFTNQSDVVKVGNSGRILFTGQGRPHTKRQKTVEERKEDTGSEMQMEREKMPVKETQPAGPSRSGVSDSEQRSLEEYLLPSQKAGDASRQEELGEKANDFEMLGNNGTSENGMESTKSINHIQELSSSAMYPEERTGLQHRIHAVSQPGAAEAFS